MFKYGFFEISLYPFSRKHHAMVYINLIIKLYVAQFIYLLQHYIKPEQNGIDCFVDLLTSVVVEW